MKVVALVVIFVLIWRWTCSTPLPCDDGNCGQTNQKKSAHLCKHMQFDDTINDIIRSKREFGLHNITSTVQRAATFVGRKLHIVNKREENKSDSDQYSQENFQNRFIGIKDRSGAIVHEEDEFNINSTELPCSKNCSNPSQAGTKEKGHVFIQIRSKRAAYRPGNHSTTIRNTLRIERQISAVKNDTQEVQNLNKTTQNSTEAQRENSQTKNETKAQSATVFQRQNNANNSTEGKQNMTETKSNSSDILVDTQKVRNKRQVFGTNNNTQDANISRIKKQTSHDHQNDTQHTTKAKRQASHQNYTLDPQNTTDTKETSHSHQNDTQNVQNKTTVKRQASHHHTAHSQNTTRVNRDTSHSHQDAQNKTRVAKQSTHELLNNTQGAQNTTKIRRGASDAKQLQEKTSSNQTNISEGAQNSTKVKRQTSNAKNVTLNSQGTAQVARNTTKVKRMTPKSISITRKDQNRNITKRKAVHVSNQTPVAQNATKAINATSPIHYMSPLAKMSRTRRQTEVSKNDTQDAQNKTTVQRRSVNSDNITKSHNATVLASNIKNGTQGSQNKTKVRRETATHKNITGEAQNITVLSRQSSDIQNRNEKNPSGDNKDKTKVKRQTDYTRNITKEAQEVTKSKVQLSAANDSKEIGKGTKVRREAPLSEEEQDTIIVIRQISSIENDTAEESETSNNFYYSEYEDIEPVSNSDGGSNKPTTKSTRRAFKPCSIQIFIGASKLNCTPEICNSSNVLVKDSYGLKPERSNKIRRQVTEQATTSLTHPGNEKLIKKDISSMNPEDLTTSEVENINIEIDNGIHHRRKREKIGNDTSTQNASKIEDAQRLQGNNQTSGNSTRIKRNESAKNITIQIHKLVMTHDKIGKTKRDTENGATNNTNATHAIPQSFKARRYVKEDTALNATNLNSTTNETTRSSSTNIQTINHPAINSSTQQNQTVSREKRGSSEAQSNMTSVNISSQNEKGKSNTKFRRHTSKHVEAQETLNKTKEYSKHHHRGMRNVTETQTNNSANLNLTRVQREDEKSQNITGENDTELVQSDEKKGSSKVKRTIPQDTQRGVKNVSRPRSPDCTDELDPAGDTDRRTRAAPADQKLAVNNTGPGNRTSVNQKSKTDTNETGKNLKSASNSTSSKNTTLSQNPVATSTSRKRTRNAYKETHIMKIARRASSAPNNDSVHNLTTSEDQKNATRKRRTILLENRDVASFQENPVLTETHIQSDQDKNKFHVPDKYVRRPLVMTFSASEQNDTSLNTVDFYELPPEERKNVGKVANKLFANEEYRSYFRYVPDDPSDHDKNNLVEKNTGVIYINPMNGTPSYDVHEQDYGSDSEEEFDDQEADDMKIAKQKAERVRCACAMYRSNSSNQERNPTFNESILNVPQGRNASDKEILCTRSCTEMIQVDIKIKQEIYCAHVKADSEKLKKFHPHDPENIPEIFEVVFCQIFTGEGEQTLQFILSWLNVILLDVVVCLTGLGIVCIYLICFVSWRKRDSGPVYTAAAFTVK